MRFRLKDDHPLFPKLEQLFDKMDELGIELWYDPYRGFIVQHEKREYELLDLEDLGDRSSLTQLPPTMEWKLCREATAEEVAQNRKIFCNCCGYVPPDHSCPGPMF